MNIDIRPMDSDESKFQEHENISEMLDNGWTMQDIPWTPTPIVSIMLESFGNGVRILACSTKSFDNEPHMRATIILNDEGRKNLANRREEVFKISENYFNEKKKQKDKI